MDNLSAANRLLLAGICSVAWLAAAQASALSFSAEMSFADGPPCWLIRGVQVFRVGQGAVLQPGDLLATEPGALVILQFKLGAVVAGLVAVGPSSHLYWADRPDRLTLAVRDGWVKVDTLKLSQNLAVEAEGPRLGAGSDAGTYVLHVGNAADEIFEEDGSIRVWTRNAAGVRTGVTSGPSRLVRRGAGDALETRVGADPMFLDAMPPMFRDPLPANPVRRGASAEPQWVREVAYADVADWLAAPRDWRRGFVTRFRPRLKDPAFEHALDADWRVRPQWAALLRPHAVGAGAGGANAAHDGRNH